MLQDQVAIVTGASRGIGREIALSFAKSGAKIVVNYAGSDDRAEEVVSEINANGGEAIKFKANVSNESEVKAMIKETITRFGSLDILVNNAGITKDNLLMRMSEADFDEVIDVNLKGVFLCTKAVTRQMMKQKSGRIINISSVVGISGNPGQANYVSAKAGVIGLTKTTAKELAPRNILVNAIAPGFIATDMTDRLTDEQKEQMLKLIPLNKLGEVLDVANVALFLASKQANYVTGQTIQVDGGMVM
ncbi:3-oxoacyl-[acyl-carrier protein] reductase [Gracilibacillus boraciitolerans JCM 21714]|uniref:3-oxoacyl-[acyl-carrier-protein] reductase n=1 Tax=Gracilibacillus boraciitolerans JCM 21714 TaxID=1298598 RepID=W4VEN8_9BACI|nr:3-oxoacyl-[acyl-carrier-protein] reductase [Gracilibacillus boraciitolerans]GAE91667.1 3-oxoacyl-[acyl-carrier protein] reductase [Gracilibacillus boraciitolerans JCM 21714]